MYIYIYIVYILYIYIYNIYIYIYTFRQLINDVFWRQYIWKYLSYDAHLFFHFKMF